jgi:serine/threonine protein kinase
MRTPEEMRQLEDCFHQAVALEGNQRASFIERLRSSNADLAAEVESLIHAYEQKPSFIESPAFEGAAAFTDESRMQFKGGQSVGKYEIVEPLGRGGMGDVYLAKDPALGRRVALKLLPAAFTSDGDRLRRFVQEARAASALNHPNILTIHEIGEAGGVHFISTEFVKGHTLRHLLLAKKPMEVSQAVEVAIQVTSALEAAHEAGIIHRDIKPENIMVRTDGYVKVLDFGLAKLTEPLFGSNPSTDSQVPTMSRNYTEPGTMMGTINYMSPEQARGLMVGPQTDIFSLGVVMYEMVGGQTPFRGQTDADVIVAILTGAHPTLSGIVKIPGSFEGIINKALQKEREERYQTAQELLADLKRLKQDLLFEQRFAVTEQPTLISGNAAISSRASSENVIRQTDSSGRITTRRRLKPALALVLTVIAATALIGGSLIWYRARATEPAPATVAQPGARTLSYFVTVQKYRAGKPYEKPFRLRDDINFEKDYRLRLGVMSSQAGYLYIFNEELGESGKVPSFVIMFPSETANNGSSKLNENQQVQIPEQTEFRFDEHEGTERIWLVWTDRRLDELEQLKRFANTKDRGSVAEFEGGRLSEFLKTHRSTNASVERSEDKPETIVRANGDILVHLISLSHH